MCLCIFSPPPYSELSRSHSDFFGLHLAALHSRRCIHSHDRALFSSDRAYLNEASIHSRSMLLLLPYVESQQPRKESNICLKNGLIICIAIAKHRGVQYKNVIAADEETRFGARLLEGQTFWASSLASWADSHAAIVVRIAGYAVSHVIHHLGPSMSALVNTLSATQGAESVSLEASAVLSISICTYGVLLVIFDLCRKAFDQSC
ncbi:uncharacterized protein CLUP02_18131 [Colletotrichum lupini]|uniref:Uncharacterized protein n=1 Tax=Colletotrichum lupini TaxID=145971 RepID=A0A9Q8SGF3_9PEZI|nr:uncharacterized protein CLUP02_18131 [Colletotrichum lupini]UQC76618.1 hypothetical protein CLUP02_18131 [Colletotrichum lupini]